MVLKYATFFLFLLLALPVSADTYSNVTMSDVALSREYTPDTGYDIFLIAGQSNTYSGRLDTGDPTTPDATLDSTDERIVQIGRWDSQDGDIILAEEPLDHINGDTTRPASTDVGWGLMFAKKYIDAGYLVGNRKVLLVPAGEGGSSFSGNDWNDGNSQYIDAITRLSYATSSNYGVNRIRGVLWMQGEDDTVNQTTADAYQAALLAMIDAMRSDMSSTTIPFVTGGMVPAYVNDQGTPGKTVQGVLTNIPNLRTYTGHASSTYMVKRRELMKKFGFKSPQQYMAWRKTHEEIKARVPFDKYNKMVNES